MKFIFPCLFLLATAAHGASGADTLASLWQKSSSQNLLRFQKACRKNQPLSFDGKKVIAEKASHLRQIQALVYAEGHCSDGDIRESIRRALGNEILLAHPALLVEALYRENRQDLSSIVEQENEEWFGVQCDNDDCAFKRSAYFAKKRSALTEAKIPKAHDAIRQILLQTLKSDHN